MKPVLRAFLVLGGSSLLLGSDCMFGRPIVDERGRYYPSDGVISCSGTRCADLPAYELDLPPPLGDSPCDADLPSAELEAEARSGPSLSGMRLSVSAELPRDVNLGALELRDACVVVSGPVRLTVGAGSTLSNVTMMLGPAVPSDAEASVRPAGRGTPDVHLGQAELYQVSLRAIDEGAPSGSVQLEFASCVECATRVDALNVIESRVKQSRLGADSLTVVGGALETVELAFEYGLLAGVLGNDLQTTACNSLSLVGATIAGRASRIGPCDCGVTSSGEMRDAGVPREAGAADARAPRPAADAGAPAFPLGAGIPEAGPPDAGVADASQSDAQSPDAGAPEAPPLSARPEGAACSGATITQSTFFGGMVDGRVRAENSTFRSVLFARHAPTSLDMWSTNIELSVTCGHAIDVRLDKTSGIGCSSCDVEASSKACRLDRAPELTLNICESFSGGLPACEPPLPVRRSPPIPMPPKLGK